MTTSPVEIVPVIWDDPRDIPFFRITARLFTPEFCLDASLLLASHDVVVGPIQAERDLIPVRVRRTR